MPQMRLMDDSFFNDFIVRDECAKLAAVHAAIEKWESVALDEWNANRPDTSSMNDLQAHWAASHFDDQAYMMSLTKQAMLGSLAVTIASSVESFFTALCEDRGAALGARAGWGQKRQRVEAILGGMSCSGLVGFGDVTRVRLLGNCFKHNEAKKNAEFVSEFGGEDDEIDFDAENWSQLIHSTKQFLLAIIERI